MKFDLIYELGKKEVWLEWMIEANAEIWWMRMNKANEWSANGMSRQQKRNLRINNEKLYYRNHGAQLNQTWQQLIKRQIFKHPFSNINKVIPFFARSFHSHFIH